MKMIKVLSFQSTQQLSALEMRSRPQPHRQHIILGHTIDKLLADIRAICLLLDGFRRDVLVDEDTQLSAQPAVRLVEVGAFEARGEPEGLRVRDLAEIAFLLLDDFGLFASDGADAEAGCVFLDYFMAVEAALVSVYVAGFKMGIGCGEM